VGNECGITFTNALVLGMVTTMSNPSKNDGHRVVLVLDVVVVVFFTQGDRISLCIIMD
jgi:hypothetical protein